MGNFPLILPWLAAAVIFETVGASFLVKTKEFTRIIPTILSIASFCVCFYALSQAMNLSASGGVIHALWCGAGVTFVALADKVLYGKKLDNVGIVGLIFIIVGCITMGVFQ
ncbi:MAG: SMR family transporter [Pantoea sp.]|uniref:DMT family transporter n=1 Tax=Pantoea sp. TaxID=69393 RepID=UPI0023922523|nr:SMR family transporter [Pantoea sp.]MDE1185466.1 SMR family transporter [Pantoea sp.]